MLAVILLFIAAIMLYLPTGHQRHVYSQSFHMTSITITLTIDPLDRLRWCSSPTTACVGVLHQRTKLSFTSVKNTDVGWRGSRESLPEVTIAHFSLQRLRWCSSPTHEAQILRR
jgi:hypothetical protein